MLLEEEKAKMQDEKDERFTWMRRRVGGSKTDRKSLRPVKIRVIPVEALLSTHLVSVHALIINLDLALLAVEAGFVEEQLL